MDIVIAAPSKTVTPDSLLADLATGAAVIHKERGNGTFRRLHFLAPGSEARLHAEWVLAKRSEGIGMKAIANEMHTSVSAVRRVINDLLLTEEIEEMDQEDLEALLEGAVEATAEMETETTN